ncbi:MAG: substrate-binding protein [Pseudolysinimonas sp.]
MQRRDFIRLAGGLGAAAALSPMLAACATPAAAGGGGSTDGPIKLGFLSALTGLETILGATQYQCFELAVNQINAAGGIAGREITTIKEDNAADSKQTIDKSNKLALSDKVTAVVGLITSIEREAALTVLPKNKVPLLYTTYYEGSYFDAHACDPYYVGLGQVPNQQIDPLVPWLSDNVGSSYYIVGSDYIWPRGTSIRLAELVEDSGGKIVGEQYFPFGTTDFSQVIRDIDSSGADIAWVPLAGTDFLTFLNQYHQFDGKAKLVSIGMDDVFAHENPAAAEGVIASQAYFMSLENDANAKFLKAYANDYGADAPVNAIGVAAYNAPWLIKAAIEEVDGSTDPDKWMPAISKVSLDGPMGVVSVDPTNQNTTQANYIGEVASDGSIPVIEAVQNVTPDVPGCSL